MPSILAQGQGAALPVRTGSAGDPSGTRLGPMRAPLLTVLLALPALAGDPPPTARIQAEAKRVEGGYAKLAVLCDQAGNRLAGSPGLERAILLAQDMLRKEGLKVWTEPVKVPHWVRGRESAAIVGPVPHRIRPRLAGESAQRPQALACRRRVADNPQSRMIRAI